MKLCKSSFEIIEQQAGLEGVYKQVELAGRTCYKSEDKITEDSAKAFVDRMIKSGHGAMLEHGTVYLKAETELVNRYIHPEDGEEEEYNPLEKYCNNKYSHVNNYDYMYVTTNLRVLVENDWLDDLQYLCEPTEYHEKRVTVKFTCDRVTGESFLRHRAIDEDHPTIEGEITREMEKDIDSFARESTRYCNYSKEKFNGEFTIITPPEFYDTHFEYLAPDDNSIFKKMCNIIANGNDDDFPLFDTWYFANLATQWAYNRLVSLGWKAQQARRVIPLDIKSPLVMTAFISDWKHFFRLRSRIAKTGKPHPQAQELADPLMDEFIKRGIMEPLL